MKTRVLIVEDEQIIAEDLAIEIRRLGYDVLGISSSGEEAIALADEARPDLVVMDVQLEGAMNGVEAAHIIRQRTGAAIAFVTAFPGAILPTGPHPEDCAVCITKPFSRMQLETALRAVSQNREK